MTTADDGAKRPLPPGTNGLPLVGETLSFAKNGFGFVTDRLEKHGGNVFRSSVLGRKTAVIAGTAACEALLDGDKLQREDAMPPHVQELFGGRSLPTLDGTVHHARKQLVLAGFGRAALESYLPSMQAAIEEALAEWSKHDEVVGLEECQKLALGLICRNVLGIDDPARLASVMADYEYLRSGFAGLPIPLPGTAYSKALKARDRLLTFFRGAIAEHREKLPDDGLTRMIRAKTDDGTTFGDDELVLEVHHVIVAGFIIFAEFVRTILELVKNPAVAERAKAEVTKLAPSGPLTLGKLASLTYVNAVVQEVKRLTPILPALFAKAKTTFEFEGHTIPEGWMVLFALRAINTDPESFVDPEKFDPERFAPGRAEHEKHPHAFVPHGPGPASGHKCPGTDYATYAMQTFVVALLRGYDFELPEQALDYDWAVTPPQPKGKLRLRLKSTTNTA